MECTLCGAEAKKSTYRGLPICRVCSDMLKDIVDEVEEAILEHGYGRYKAIVSTETMPNGYRALRNILITGADRE